jgi:2-polyprenyl-3-methyl-5-hydroxy-6-metoxy-1,4-benzoquinol methylase
MQSLTDDRRMAETDHGISTAATGPARKSIEYYSEPRLDIQALIEARGKRILDVGCAAGEFGGALKRAGATEVIGIECAPEAAARAREKLDHVFVGDVQSLRLPLDEGSFDYIIFADVLEHTVDPWSLLATYRRYLKADGRVIASLPNVRFYAVIARLIFNRWGYRESGILDATHLRFFTWPTIKEMFERAGLTIERVRPVYRLLEDQSRTGRVGALASRWFCRLVAPLILWRHFFTFQYLIVAKRAEESE